MMRRVLLIIVWVFGLSLPALPQAKKPPAPVEEPTPVLTVPKDCRYNTGPGRRDPFVNPVPKPKVAANAPRQEPPRPPGLRGVRVGEAQISGVVASKEPSMNVVIIAAPGAPSPYFARVGDQLFDGVVRSISFTTVIFTMTAQEDPKAPREVVRQVRPTPGDKK